MVGRAFPSGRSVERLHAIAAAGLSEFEFCWEAATDLRRLIPFDAWCCIPVDCRTMLPSGAHAGENPAFAGPATVRRLLAIEFDEGDVNLHAALAQSARPVGSLSAATGADLARSRRWRELFRPLGLGDELRASLVADGACWGCLSLYREGSSPRFAPAEAESLAAFVAALARAMRQALFAHLAMPHAPEPAGVVVLDQEAGQWSATPGAQRWLRGLSRADGPSGDNGAPQALPAPVHALAARLRAIERDGAGCHPAPAIRARTTDGVWLALRAERLVDAGTAGKVAITVAPAGAAQIVPLLLQGRGLTPRERELVARVLRGISTKAIAREMDISPNTVQDHLKAVFAKTGLRSRRELVARLLGQAKA